MTNTFSGIRPADAPGFLAAQLAGAIVATLIFKWLAPASAEHAAEVVVSSPDLAARDAAS